MPTIFYTLAILACPVGMGLMMWLMMRGTKRPEAAVPTGGEDPTGAELARLRAEIDQLEAAQREANVTSPDSKRYR